LPLLTTLISNLKFTIGRFADNHKKLSLHLYRIGTHQKCQRMLVVSSREFRDRQKSYLDKVDAGMEILIQRGRNKSYKITSVSEDDTLMIKEEFFAKIDRSLQEAKEGKTFTMLPNESLDDFLTRLKDV